MVASSIFFNGRLIRVPGSYSEVDPSGLEGVGLGANGIVVLIGPSEGGIPARDIIRTIDIPRYRSAAAAQNFARSGPLREAAAMAFSPSNDPAIPGGAVEVVLLKTNPATQASATFSNGSGASLVVTAGDYGDFTNQINLTIATGTNQGKLVTAAFEDVTEAVDDIGGDPMIQLLYRPSTGDAGVGWDTMTAEVTASGVRANALSSVAGADGDVSLGQTGTFTAVSTDAADNVQRLTVVGLDAGSAVARTVTLTGTTPVTVGSFSDGVFGAFLDAPAVGAVTVDAAGTNLTLAAGEVVTGGEKWGAAFVANGAISLTADAADTSNVYVVGRNALGARVVESIALTGTTRTTGAVTFTEIEAVLTGAVPAARTVTVQAIAAQTSNTTQNTLQKVVDFFNARQRPNLATPTLPFGFTATLVTGFTTLASTNLDLTATPVNIDDPVMGSFFADLWALENALNTQFSLVNGARSPGAIGVPDDTSNPVFLTGGTEGATTFAEWQGALNLLKGITVSTIVPLTADPAVHAAVKAHCEFMAGIGRSERDAIVGLQNSVFTGPPTLAEITAQIVALNTRHMRACAQNIERFDTAGERATFPPYFQAVLGAGMQAGSGVGVSLTNKIANCLSISQDASWNPIDDAETLIERGLFFMAEVENVGRRWVRNITTNVSSSNIANTEASVNEAVNFAVNDFRTAMEIAVGSPGFSGTINATKGTAVNRLGLQIDSGILTAYRNLEVSLAVDVLDVAVEIAPIIPINFVRNVFHLVNNVQTAA